MTESLRCPLCRGESAIPYYEDATRSYFQCPGCLLIYLDPDQRLRPLEEVVRFGVMTRFCGVDAPFAHWWYRRDRTHVCFYSTATMEWIAEWKGWDVDFPRQHVAIFTVA